MAVNEFLERANEMADQPRCRLIRMLYDKTTQKYNEISNW